MAVVPLTTATKPVLAVDEAVIAALEDLMERAKAGEIQGVAYVTVQSDGMGALLSTGTGYKGEGIAQNVHATIGIIEALKGRMIAGFELI